MYTQRNQHYNLNVFLTHDADILVRAYNHEPFMVDSVNVRTSVKKFPRSSISVEGFSDINATYSQTDGVSVRDSCVWLCPKILDKLCLISFDSIRLNVGFFTRQFRVLAAICGNDYSEGLLTDSMLLGIMNMSLADKVILNGLSNILEIVAAFLYLGIKYNGIPKTPHIFCVFKYAGPELTKFETSIRNYIRFIETGISPPCDNTENIDMPNISHTIIVAMRGATSFESIYDWVEHTSLTRAIRTAKTTWTNENRPNVHFRGLRTFCPVVLETSSSSSSGVSSSKSVHWPTQPVVKSALTLKLSQVNPESLNITSITEEIHVRGIIGNSSPSHISSKEKTCSITGRVQSCSINIPVSSGSTYTTTTKTVSTSKF